MAPKQLIPLAIIEKRIFLLRDKKVMFDSDLAELYGVATKILNQAARRNRLRFPVDFMFQMTPQEYQFLRSRFVTLEKGRGRHKKYLPYLFTEQGVAMLSSVLRSPQKGPASDYGWPGLTACVQTDLLFSAGETGALVVLATLTRVFGGCGVVLGAG